MDNLDNKNDFFKDLSWDKIKTFCIDKKRYFGAVGLLVVLIIVLCCFTNPTGKNGEAVADGDTEITSDLENTTENEEATEISQEVVDNFKFDEQFESNDNDAMKELFQNYYAAYAAASYDNLSKAAYPISENEQSYIAVMSKYYEDISNITYYSKKGVEEGSYFVSVYNEIKFEGVDTLAPTLDFFYVETDKAGNLYINNAYSVFNQSFAENPMDSGITALIQKYMQEQDFVKLQQETQAKYDEAVSSDKKLKKMLKKTLDKAIREWLATIQQTDVEPTTETTTEPTTEVTTEKETESEKATESEAKEEEPQPEEPKEEEPKVTQVKTIDIVNVRAAASADAELLGKLTEGVILNKLGEDGEWTIVEYSGGKDGKGYIKTEFLKAVKN